LAEETAVRAVSPRAASLLDELPGGVRAAGRRLLDDGLIVPGETSEELAAKLGAAQAKAEGRVNKLLEVADQSQAAAVPVRAILRDGWKEAEALRGRVDGATAAKAIEGQLAGIERIAKIPPVGTKGELPGFSPRDIALEHARLTFAQATDLAGQLEGPLAGIVRREVDTAAEAAAKHLGGNFASDLEDAQLAVRQYQALSAAPAHAPGPGIALGAAAVGMLTHGPLGAATGIATGMAKRLIAERGLTTGAAILDKLSALRGAERAVQRTDREIARGVDGLFAPSKRAPMRVGRVQHGKGVDPYEARVAAVQSAARDPAGAAVLAAAPIAAHAPKVAAAFRAAAVRATQVLVQAIPKTPPTPSLTPQLAPKFPATLQRKQKFNRIFDAVHDPKTVLQAAGQGTVTPDMVAAASKSHPALWGKMTRAVETRLSEAKTPLSTQQRVNISILLQTPMHTPEVARTFQQTFALPSGPQGPQQNQDEQHRNKGRYGNAPRRPITATAKQVGLTIGRPEGT
jgi:hypothetical protein